MEQMHYNLAVPVVRGAEVCLEAGKSGLQAQTRKQEFFRNLFSP